MYIFHPGVTNKRKSDILPEELVFVLQTSFDWWKLRRIGKRGESDASLLRYRKSFRAWNLLKEMLRRNYISRCRETLHYARKRTSLVIFFKLLSYLFIRKKQSSFLFIYCEAELFLASEWNVKLEGNVS